MPTATWKGSKNIHLQPGYPRENIRASGIEVVLLFSGPYAALRAKRPAIGQWMTDYPGPRVDEVEIYPREAGKAGAGFMQVTLRGETPSSQVVEAAVDETRDEFEWEPVEKALETHPTFRAGGAKELTQTDLNQIAEWRATDASADRTAAYNAMNNNAKAFVAKLERGQESWTAYAPVIRRTTVGAKRLTVSPCGKSGGEPSGLGPSGYTFVKTADRAVRQGRGGKWERVEEWTGAEFVDADLYPAS